MVDGLKCKQQQKSTCSITSIRIAYELKVGKFSPEQKQIWKDLYIKIDKYYKDYPQRSKGFQALESLYLWYYVGLPKIDIKPISGLLCSGIVLKKVNASLKFNTKFIFSIRNFVYAYKPIDEEYEEDEEEPKIKKITEYQVEDPANPYLQIIPYFESARRWTDKDEEQGFLGPSGPGEPQARQRVWQHSHNENTNYTKTTQHAICCVGKRGEYYVLHDSELRNGTCRKYIHEKFMTLFDLDTNKNGLINAIYYVDTETQGRGTPTVNTDLVLGIKKLKL
tara:strand:+ start:223 stop:1059 length:837 start_codon:yes stop_codon:yes gene_type:complete